MITNSCKLGIIVVSYYPNESQIYNFFSLVEKKNYKVVIVDNSCNDKVKKKLKENKSKSNLKLIFPNTNNGIASAFNSGINYLINEGYEYVLLLDQDTDVNFDIIDKHFNDFIAINDDRKLACGWSFNSIPYFLKYRFFSRKVYMNKGIIDVDILITSGMIIDLKKIKIAGFFNEELFMDFVDMEWCQRVKKSNFNIYGNFDVHCKSHPIGENSINFFGLTFPAHKPFRYYYMVKNFLIIREMNHINGLFLFHETIQMIFKFFFYCIFSKKRYEIFKYMIKGYIDGRKYNK